MDIVIGISDGLLSQVFGVRALSMSNWVSQFVVAGVYKRQIG